MKTYHMYNADSISAQSKLKEAEKQEEKQIGKSVKQEDKQTPRSPDSTSNVKFEEKHVRRSSVKKIEKMKEKVLAGCTGATEFPPQIRISFRVQVLFSTQLKERQIQHQVSFRAVSCVVCAIPGNAGMAQKAETGLEWESSSCLLGIRGYHDYFVVQSTRPVLQGAQQSQTGFEGRTSAIGHLSSSALRFKPVEGMELFLNGFRLWKDQVQALEEVGCL